MIPICTSVQDTTLSRRNVLDVLKESLNDCSLVLGDAFRMGIQSEVRYKLIIDPSEDDSLVRLLFEFGILDATKTKVYVCSDFPGNSHSEVGFLIYVGNLNTLDS